MFSVEESSIHKVYIHVSIKIYWIGEHSNSNAFLKKFLLFNEFLFMFHLRLLLILITFFLLLFLLCCLSVLLIFFFLFFSSSFGIHKYKLSCYMENSLHSTTPMPLCLISFIIIIDTIFFLFEKIFFLLLFGEMYCDFYLHLTRCSPHLIIFIKGANRKKISLFPSGFISP